VRTFSPILVRSLDRHSLFCSGCLLGASWQFHAGAVSTVKLLHGQSVRANSVVHLCLFGQLPGPYPVSHLSQDKQFDDAAQVIGSTGLPAFYMPGEHDVIDEGLGKSCLARYGKGSAGSGWYSFDQDGVHFIGLVRRSLSTIGIFRPLRKVCGAKSRNQARPCG
jgi:hypothetical protein